MKKVFCYTGALCFVLFIFICFKFFSFGTQVYSKNNFKLTVPFYSKIYNIVDSNDEYVFKFRTFLSKSVLLNKTDNILNGYEKYTCQNQKFYYDKDNDITIKRIDIGSKLFINEYSYIISTGIFDNNYCSKVIDYKDIKYQMKNVFIKPHEYEYKNMIDGNIYNVYSNLENKDILLNTGMNKMNYLRNMLRYGWVSMNLFIDYLDFISANCDSVKIETKDYIAYETKEFTLLKCDNNDIYIYENEYDYSNFVCK